MRRAFSLYRSSVGMKILMALSGVIFFLFVLVHMIGNLKIYQGPEKYDAYADFLRNVGYPALGHEQGLWIFRLILLACLAAHVISAATLWLQSRRARPESYKKFDDLSFSYASRTMRWGGVILAGFVVYHILHLTTGQVHPEFVHGSVYRNVVVGFQSWPASLAYIVAMIPLGLHIYHGLWSGTQTLAIDHPTVKKWRRPVAAAVAAIIVVANVSIPVSVLTGLLGLD